MRSDPDRPVEDELSPGSTWKRESQSSGDGKKTANTRITVVHNGVKIHDDVELPKGTGNGGKLPEVPEGNILLQGHGNPVQFRNIWIVEKSD